MDFVLNDYHRNVSDEELLKDIIRVAKTLGKESITLKEYKDSGGLYDRTTYTRRFGSWVNTLQKAGLQPTTSQIARHGIPEKTLISDLQKVAKILGKAICQWIRSCLLYNAEKRPDSVQNELCRSIFFNTS